MVWRFPANLALLIGLLTFSGGCGDPKPSVYIEISSFSKWIYYTGLELLDLEASTEDLSETSINIETNEIYEHSPEATLIEDNIEIIDETSDAAIDEPEPSAFFYFFYFEIQWP